MRKAWIISQDGCCDVCAANAAQGAIGLDAEFDSGDPAPPGHPRCRCAVVPVVDDGVTKAFDPNQVRDDGGRWMSSLSMAVAAAGQKPSRVVRAIVGPVRRAGEIAKLTGVDVRGFKHSATDQSMRHALAQHGSVAGERRRGQIAVTTADFQNLRAITTAPDAIVPQTETGKHGEPRLIFEKTISGVHYFYVAQIRNGKKRIEMVTMWKK